MKQMFFHQGDLNNSLKVLDLSNFDTSKVTNMVAMFWGLKALKTIYVSSMFDMSNVSDSVNMFNGVSTLV
jgi:surface protein